MEIPQKIKNRATIQFRYFTPEYSKQTKTLI